MNYHLYRRADGRPEVTDHQLPLEIYPGYEYIGPLEEKISVDEMDFDEGGQTLVPTKTTLIARKRAQIEAERQRRNEAPIDFNGSLLDADPTARENITGVLNKVRELIETGQTMPLSEMMWKDADDGFLTFSDIASYRQFLGGLLVAIVSRGTDLYGWKWQKVSQLAGLATIEDLQAFDPTS